MTEKKPSVALSMGVVGNIIPEGFGKRFIKTRALAKQVNANGGWGECGIELMCRSVDDAGNLPAYFVGRELEMLRELAEKGAEISLHAPLVGYGCNSEDERTVLRGIRSLSEKAPLHHVVFHASGFAPGSHNAVRSWDMPAVFENGDNIRDDDYRTLDELQYLAEIAGLVIDIGHVHHHFVESAGEVLEQIVTRLHEKIAAYHVSYVGEGGWHHPMAGSPVQSLLARVPLDGAMRVLESPIQSRKDGIKEILGELAIATANIRV